jgi:putative heme-binding domain-containing protein
MKLLLVLLAWAAAAPLQQSRLPEKRNPLARDPAAIAAGEKAFQARCAFCHGTDAAGTGRGSNLTAGRWAHGGKDAELFKTIREGVTGTQMPPHDLPENAIWELVSFIRSLGGSGAQAPVPGNPARGEQLFFGKGGCSRCHMIRGRGAPIGPELSAIGAERSAKAIRLSLVEPDREIAEGFAGIELFLRGGERLTGAVRNEDSFSIQVVDLRGRYASLDKTRIVTVKRLERSLMPASAAGGLAPDELQDLLAFLDRQRPPDEEGGASR